MSKRYEKSRQYTEKYKNLLLPCRICGNKSINIVIDRMIFLKKYGYSVCCSTDKCDCIGVYLSVKEAVEKWNNMQKEKQNGMDKL